MPTVVLLTTVHPRNDTRIFFKEAQSLAAGLNHSVVLMVADGKGDVPAASQGRVTIHDLGALGTGRMGRVLNGTRRAFAAIRRLRPAVVHFHDPELIPLGVLLRLLGVKVIYDVHEDLPRQVFSKYYIPRIIRYPLALAMALVEWVGARLWTAIIPATPLIASTPILRGRFPAAKTVVVHNFPMGEEFALSRSIPYAQRPEGFAYLGGIEKVRGIVEMVKAFERLPDFPEAKLELAGWFSPAGLEDEVRALGGWSSVNYHGEVDRPRVAEILGESRAGLVVLHPEPTHIESYAIKMFEYMYAGLPVIASDFPLWKRIIESAGCGLLVDPLDPNAIAQAMRWILEHPVEAEAMGKQGRQAAEQIYNWKTEAAKLVDLYKTLLSA